MVGLRLRNNAAGPAVAACKVSKIAELPVTLTGRRAMVDAKFGTHDTRFIVDSGAFYSTVSRASAAEFGLSSEPAPPWFRLRGVNGDTSAAIASAKDFSLAGLPIPRVSFIVGGTDTGTAGLLGQNSGCGRGRGEAEHLAAVFGPGQGEGTHGGGLPGAGRCDRKLQPCPGCAHLPNQRSLPEIQCRAVRR